MLIFSNQASYFNYLHFIYYFNRYGWTAEQIAVVPRLTSASTCGQGKTGVVKWYASADKKFGVFCFNASGTVKFLHSHIHSTMCNVNC